MLNAKTEKVVKLNLTPPSILQLIDEERYQYESDTHGNVWITTFGNGLFRYNINSGSLDHFSYSNKAYGLVSNYLLSIVLDKNENIWVGTENMGVNKLNIYFVQKNKVIL